MSCSLLRLFLLRSQNLIIPDKRLGSGYISCRQINNLSIFFPPDSSFLEKSGSKEIFPGGNDYKTQHFQHRRKRSFPERQMSVCTTREFSLNSMEYMNINFLLLIIYCVWDFGLEMGWRRGSWKFPVQFFVTSHESIIISK